MEETKKQYATEIYLDGSVCYHVKDSFNEVMGRLEVLGEDEFIYFTLDDGCRAALRKRNIVAVNQYEDDESTQV